MASTSDAMPNSRKRPRTEEAEARSAKRRVDCTDRDRYMNKIAVQLANIEDITSERRQLQQRIPELCAQHIPADVIDELRQPVRWEGTAPAGREDMLFNVLDGLADFQELIRPVRPKPKLPDRMIDYLLRLLVDYWRTGTHPALVPVNLEADEAEPEEDARFHLYVRMSDITVRKLREIISKLKTSRPVNTPSLLAMEDSLRLHDRDDQIVYDKYMGETIATPRIRQIADLHTASGKAGIKSKWLHRLNEGGGNFQVFEFELDMVDGTEVPPGCTPAGIPEGMTAAQAKQAVPEWGNLEYILILAAGGRSWNSASGGTEKLDAETREVMREVLKDVSVDDGVEEDISGWMLKLYRAFHGLFAEGIPIAPTEGKTTSAPPKGMSKPRMIGDKALKQAAANASLASDYFLLAKDVTVYDGLGYGHWWDATAGDSPQFLQLILKEIASLIADARAYESPSFNLLKPKICDYWALTLTHVDMDLADIFIALILEKIKPRLILTHSEKVHNMITRSQFQIASGHDTLVQKVMSGDFSTTTLESIRSLKQPTLHTNQAGRIDIEVQKQSSDTKGKQKPRGIKDCDRIVDLEDSAAGLAPDENSLDGPVGGSGLASTSMYRRKSDSNNDQEIGIISSDTKSRIGGREMEQYVKYNQDAKGKGKALVVDFEVDEIQDSDEDAESSLLAPDLKDDELDDDDDDIRQRTGAFDTDDHKDDHKDKTDKVKSDDGDASIASDHCDKSDEPNEGDKIADITTSWSALEEGNFLEVAGTITVVCYGANRWGLSIAGIDTGYINYSPVLRKSIFPIFFLIHALHIVVQNELKRPSSKPSSASSSTVPQDSFPSVGPWENEEDCQAFLAALLQKEGVAKLNRALQERTKKAIQHVKAFNSLAVLTHADDDVTTALGRFDRLSKLNQRVRADILSKQVLAKGLPGSPERKVQVEALILDSTFRLNNPDCPKGSPQFWDILMAIKPGTSFMGSWIRARYSSPAQEASLKNSRVHAGASTRRLAASGGAVPGWNAKKSPREVLDILLDVTRIDADRLKHSKSAMRILRCLKPGCKFPLGLETEYKRVQASALSLVSRMLLVAIAASYGRLNFRSDRCQIDQPPFSFAQCLPEWMEGEILCFPYQLIEKGFLTDLDMTEHLIMDEHGSPSWVDDSKGTASQRAVYRKIQHEYHNLFSDADPESIDADPYIVAMYNDLIERL